MITVNLIGYGFTQDLDTDALSIKYERNNNDIIVSLTGDLTFYGQTYQWLIDRIVTQQTSGVPVEPLEIEVYINDRLAVKAKIDGNKFRFCPVKDGQGGTCAITLEYVDSTYFLEDLKSKGIADNNQHPNGQFFRTIDFHHPAWRYCLEGRPKNYTAFFLGFWYILLAFLSLALPGILAIFLVVYIISLQWNALQSVIESLTGLDIGRIDTFDDPRNDNPFSATWNFFNAVEESVNGCRRAHIVPFVRTWLNNAAIGAGLTLDDDGIFTDQNSVWYNLGWFGKMNHEGRTDYNDAVNDWLRYSVTTESSFEWLQIFCADLRLYFWVDRANNVLVIRKQQGFSPSIFFDARTEQGLLEVCYRSNQAVFKRYFDYQQKNDAKDIISGEALTTANDVVNTGNGRGYELKEFSFAPARGRQDSFGIDIISHLSVVGYTPSNPIQYYITINSFGVGSSYNLRYPNSLLWGKMSTGTAQFPKLLHFGGRVDDANVRHDLPVQFDDALVIRQPVRQWESYYNFTTWVDDGSTDPSKQNVPINAVTGNRDNIYNHFIAGTEFYDSNLNVSWSVCSGGGLVDEIIDLFETGLNQHVILPMTDNSFALVEITSVEFNENEANFTGIFLRAI
jgi:hypothetical protein